MRGEYRHSLDDKGRVICPSRLRAGLGERFIVTKGLDGCLSAYPEREWNRFVETVNSFPPSRVRKLQRFFFAGACTCEPDSQGRVPLPQTLRDYAGIKRDIVFAGLETRVEIWAAERWDADIAPDLGVNIEEEMRELGL